MTVSTVPNSELLQQLEPLVTHLDAVLWLTTPDKRVMTYVSAAFERIYGYSADELRERPALLYELVHPDDREALKASSATQSDGGWERRYRIVRLDGSVRWIFARAFPVHDRTGRLTHIAGISEDVTEQVVAEQALAGSRQRFDALAEHSGVGIWEIDREGYTTYINPAMCEQLEIESATALSGETYQQFFTAESLETMRREHARRAAGTPSSYQVEVVGARGGRRQVMVHGAPVLGPDGEVLGLIGTFSDVTEIRRLEQGLGQSQKLEAIGQLAAGVAHDFNNLLVPIIAYSEMAIESLGAGKVSDDMRVILQAGHQVKELTQQLLAFARKQSLSVKPLSLSSEISGFATVLRRMLREDIKLDLSLADGSALIRADATKIRQVLLNLAGNAQDAMPEGGKLSISSRTILADEQSSDGWLELSPGTYVELRVQDTGAGMDSATQARVFEPFFTTKNSEAGTGLGLSMVYGCVRQHGGQIRCTSLPGSGTTFTMVFAALDNAQVAPAPAPRGQPQLAATATILLVEDQDAVRRLVAQVLTEEGYHVVQASDGREALERAAALHGAIGLLISDVIMPNMGGVELVRELRARHGDVRVLFISGYSEDAARLEREPGARFLPKPFAVEALKRTVRELLA